MFKNVLLVTLVLIIPLTQASAQEQWEPLGLDEHVQAIIVHPDNDDIIYAGAYNVFYIPEAIGGVFKSVDGGATWDTLVTGGISVSCMVMDPTDPDIIYAGLNSANSSLPGIIKTTNGGQDWVWSHEGIYVDWETEVSSLAINPQHPDTLFAGTGSLIGSDGLYRSTNGGESWEDVTNQILDNGMMHIAIDPVNSQNIYVCTVGAGRVFKSTDGGDNWQQLDLEIDSPKTIVVDPSDPNTVYIGAYVWPHTSDWIGALYKSTDAGSTWTSTPLEGEGSVITEIIIHPDHPEWLFMSSGIGFTVSPDGGATWDVHNEGLPSDYISSLACNSTTTTFYGYCLSGSGWLIYKRQFTPIGIEDPEHESAVDWSVNLYQNYPNPFIENTAISFHLPTNSPRTGVETHGRVSLRVFNTAGQLIKSLINGHLSPGPHTMTWDGTNAEGLKVSSGVYLYQLQTAHRVDTRSMILLRN